MFIILVISNVLKVLVLLSFIAHLLCNDRDRNFTPKSNQSAYRSTCEFGKKIRTHHSEIATSYRSVASSVVR